ncbi:molybdopterin molybdotransferase MoeA [Rhodanobacter sp. B2A1Ga4]|uniref:molybdopterin molybdotransferase MoeA n=1 Tax=Rhodanobacter sp. B2A1Ga4 TaxID=2778647 RepID=UPI001B39A76B|nr:gephyrin-like molybdotransferase Glp [Rhodanobacter sp. B2A1Ga4]MBQ4855863.1 molybdopterin molybdotransferase MoeA [Rhodanobacter sp. B2A1Ga4]
MSHDLLDPAEALDIILDACASLPAEDCDVVAALGRVLAQPVRSAGALPPFDNSAMDGYALGGGAEPLPAGSEWPIEGEQAAGDGVRHDVRGAWEIMTGARLPDGLDRVIPVEQTERLEAPPRVRLLAELAAGQNVRTAGSDVAAGETVLAAGTVLAPQHLMLLAALGVARVQVIVRPRVAVLCTGRELVDDVAQALAPGQIRNSNGPFLAARLPLAGAELAHIETVGDEVDTFLAAFERARAARPQVMISTGAVSMGRYDFVPQALERLGAEVRFHKLAIRPGKPLLFARLPDGTLFFGLPGNPIAVAVGLRFFVEPALRAMLGLPCERPWRVPLSAAYAKKPRLRFHLKSRVGVDAAGRLAATVLQGQESYRMRSLAAANAWVVVPVEATAMPAETLVDVYGLGHLESPNLGGSAA